MRYFDKLKLIPIILTNLFFIACIVKANFIDPISDTNGMFTIIILFFLIGYNICILFLNYIRKWLSSISEMFADLFTLLAISTPILLIIYYYVCNIL